MRKNKIRILHVAQAAGGVDRYIRMLLKYLDLCNRCRCRIEPLSRQVIVLFQASNLSSSEVSRLDFVLSESGRLFRASQFHQRDPCEIFL